MNNILNLLKDNLELDYILQKKDGLGNLSLTQEALLLAATFQKQPQNIVIVKSNLYSAQKLYERMSFLLQKHVFLFAREDSLRVQAIAQSPELAANQIDVMNQILQRQPCICITHIGALLYPLINPNVFQEAFIKLQVNDEITMNDFKKRLVQAGYTNTSRVSQPLTFASRGGIVDVYSINYEHAIRIEFFDTVIDSIRFFDVLTQKTISQIKEVEIIPASEYLINEEELEEIKQNVKKLYKSQIDKVPKANQNILKQQIEDDFLQAENGILNHNSLIYLALRKQKYSILDYMKNPLVICSSKEEIENMQKQIQEETLQYLDELNKEGRALFADDIIQDPFTNIKMNHLLYFYQFQKSSCEIQTSIIEQVVEPLSTNQLIHQIVKESKNKKVILCGSEHELDFLKNCFMQDDISYRISKTCSDIKENGIYLYPGNLYEGFICLKENISVYSSKELFHKQVKKSPFGNKFKEAKVLNDYVDLQIGDFVVHKQYGIGKYLGIENRLVNGIHKDFLKVVYQGDDVLFIPLNQFQLIRKFMSKEGKAVKLHKLGSSEWEKTKKKVSLKVEELAQRLITLYSLREEKQGYAFSKDSIYQKQFEEDFPFELTKDQVQAVNEIKEDMESTKPMDRLLCGDVGFGKTEVAIRASFKAVVDQKQVAFLCPTTILSLQHYKTFQKRYQNFPVNIAVLNRFMSKQEVTQTLNDLKDGKIDILIGTHRILSKDVQFHDLGLLIIDEEQRFGVEHKEKIKEIRTSIDVLSMSATPIPRTLQMSLIGIRSLSQLETPPNNRMPVQTYVIEKDFHVIKEIIERELVRGGQVYYLFNNVKEIYQVATKIKTMIPDVEIGVAHGQMSKNEIEDVMLQFTEGKYQILVCTTIVETGIDIPNANTMIIDEADRFGLSQLYQIKGRVGRSDRLAYAYLMYSPKKQLSEIASKRLKAIKEFTQLGSGYKIAMKDLTIRGAGDMLGPQQAGFMDTVGIDMYIEMLHEAIKKRKNNTITVKEEQSPQITNIELDAYIPESFAPNDYEKITLYQRIEQINTMKELIAFEEEIVDNYGKLPKAVQLLLEKKHLDMWLNESHIDDFKEQKQQVVITFSKDWSNTIDGVQLFEEINKIQKDILIRYQEQKITIIVKKSKFWLSIINQILPLSKSLYNQK